MRCTMHWKHQGQRIQTVQDKVEGKPVSRPLFNNEGISQGMFSEILLTGPRRSSSKASCIDMVPVRENPAPMTSSGLEGSPGLEGTPPIMSSFFFFF